MTESETVTEPQLREQVRAAWAETLDVPLDSVPLTTTFFDAGGNSLLLLLLWELLDPMTERDLRAADLFEHNTVTAQAEFLAGGRDAPVPGRGGDRGGLLGRARRGGEPR